MRNPKALHSSRFDAHGHTQARNLKYLCETSSGSRRQSLTQTAHTVALSSQTMLGPGMKGGTYVVEKQPALASGKEEDPTRPALRLKTRSNHVRVEQRGRASESLCLGTWMSTLAVPAPRPLLLRHSQTWSFLRITLSPVYEGKVHRSRGLGFWNFRESP